MAKGQLQKAIDTVEAEIATLEVVRDRLYAARDAKPKQPRKKRLAAVPGEKAGA